VSADAAVAWLREQVLARLALAREAADGEEVWEFDAQRRPVPRITGAPWESSYGDGTWDCDDLGDGCENLRRAGIASGRHIAANDPRQVIADCESDLAILGEHYILTTSDRNEAYEEFSVVRIGGADRDHGCVTCHYYGMGGVKGYGICRTVKAVASGYRHHPGWAEHWGEPA